jgi:hypothetical protein
MIYEMRTYTLKPGSVQEFFKRWEPLVPGREKFSRLGALWATEIGPLNEVIHVWPYESIEERNRVRAEATASGNWPPPTRELIVRQKSEILHPAPFMRPMEPRQLGNVYEMRIYTYQPGTIPQVIERWSERIAAREQFSPLAACWYNEFGDLNRWIHVWPYESLAERERVRAASFASGQWPAPTREWLVSQETKILVPAPFSPMR